jgi:acetoacetate decarboxylase
MKLVPISVEKAKAYFERHSAYRGEFTLAIAAADEHGVHGVIAMVADGERFWKEQISTDGNAQVGSLLYGAAVRAGMALGYKAMEFQP